MFMPLLVMSWTENLCMKIASCWHQLGKLLLELKSLLLELKSVLNAGTGTKFIFEPIINVVQI